jgi:hypothetical protein
MKLNRFVCPQCHREALSNDAYITCDGCGAFFYFASSYVAPVPIKVVERVDWQGRGLTCTCGSTSNLPCPKHGGVTFQTTWGHP